MKINNGSNQQVFNTMLHQNKGNDTMSALQKRLTMLDKQIEKLKENDKLSAEEKQTKLEMLEQNKEELMALIEEEQINKKMNELEEKVEKVEEANSKFDHKPATPQEELAAELGINEVQSGMMFGIANHFERGKEKLSIARNMRAEATIQKREIDTDRSRGQKISAKSYKVQRMIDNRSGAGRVEKSAFSDIGHVTKTLKKVNKSTEKVQEKNQEILKEQENQEEKNMSLSSVGTHVDVKL